MIALFAGCTLSAVDTPLSDEWPAVPASIVSQVKVDAFYPTDLLLRPDGTVWVLDGYRSRIVPIAPDGRPGAPLGEDEGWGRPVRLAASNGGGAWLVDPAGRLVEIDGDAHTVRVVALAATDAPAPRVLPSGPVAVVTDGLSLVVSDRHGTLSWIDPDTGSVTRRIDADPEGNALGTITDLARDGEGNIIAADSVAGRIHRIAPDGSWTSFGRYGLWVGTLKQPKSTVAVDGAALVADSALRAVQLFARDGSARGVVTVDGAPPVFDHPIALELASGGTLLVLDAATATVWTLALDPDDFFRRMRTAPPRWKRKALVDTYEGPAGRDGRDCLQCHDGLVNDGRQVWDTTLGHHPIHEKLEAPLPAFFTLDEQGEMTCTTCHSPHGTSTLGDVAAVEAEGDRAQLVRHAATEPFLRVSRRDSALCVACHTENPHEDAVESLGIGGGAHPVGAELAASMEGRGEGTAADAQCLGCHAVHGADGEHMMRGETDGQLCLTCHEEEALPGASHPIGLHGAPAQPAAAAALPLDSNGGATCRTCHDLAGGHGSGLIRLPEDGSDVCSACHATQASLVAAGHGGVPGAEGIACLGCHDPHGDRPSASLLRDLGARTDADPLACLGCHAPGKRAATAGVSPGRTGHPVDGIVHEAGDDPLTCLTCHDPHGPKAQASECADCHTEQEAAEARGGHGDVACLECHPAHRDPPRAGLAGENPGSRVCLGCHLDPQGAGGARPLAAWSHPDLVFRPDGTRWAVLDGVPLYGADGALLPAGQNGDLTCTSCHVTHGPDAVEPGDHLRRPGWKDVCTSCHGNDALPLYRWFHDPDRRERPEEAP